MGKKKEKRNGKGKRLNVDFDTALRAWNTLLDGREQIGDVVPRVAVQTGTQSLLVQVVGNETNATAEHKQTVQHTHLQVVLSLLGREGARVTEQVHEADGHGAINVEDQVVLL